MPRNASSVYSLPAGNPVIPGTVIATTWANTTLTDIATALTNSLSTDGSTATVSLAGKLITGAVLDNPNVQNILSLTGGRIAFPAVQVPSVQANVLDDYEEGTWTPTLTFTTPGTLAIVYSSRTGQYTKIGQFVSVQFEVITSTYTPGTAAGSMLLSGIPFVPSLATTVAPGKLSWQGITKANYTEIGWDNFNASGTSQFIASGSGQLRSNVAVGNTTSGTQLTLYGNSAYTSA